MVWSVNNSISEQLDTNSAQKQNVNNQAVSSPENKRIPRVHSEEILRGPAKQPPKLNANYNMEDSLEKAYGKAIDFANRVLLDDDVNMKLHENDSGESQAIVQNIETQDVVQKYSALQVLQMYSSNYNLQGIVIDAII